MSLISSLFTPDFERYEGVRPVNIWGLRLFFALMCVFVAPGAWKMLVTHEGSWDHVRAVAWCVWAAYTTLAFLGVFKPLKLLPIMLFMIFYKSLWLLFVAYPLWSAGQLAGSPAEKMAYTFAGIVLPILVVPWGYVARTYLPWPRSARAASRAA